MTHHFAHSDKSKCDSETQIHFWIKNELIKQGDKFKIRLDKDIIKEFVCKEVLTEQQYKTEFSIYKPDITIITESDETIYFEVAKTNKKKLEEYLDQWLELGNVVVEVETKNLINGNEIKEFKALFYDGKCFNVNKEDRDYYETIGNVKTGFKKGLYTKEEMDSVNWLWKDMNKYMAGELDIETLSDEIQAVENGKLRNIIVDVLKKKSCNRILDDYVNHNINKIKKRLDVSKVFSNYSVEVQYVKNTRIYDRIFRGCRINFYYNDKCTEIYTKMDYDSNSNYIINTISLSLISKLVEKIDIDEEKWYVGVSIKNSKYINICVAERYLYRMGMYGAIYRTKNNLNIKLTNDLILSKNECLVLEYINNYILIHKICSQINERYEKVRGDWSVKFNIENDCFDLYKNYNYITTFELNKDITISENDLFKYLTDNISNYIRDYIYKQ